MFKHHLVLERGTSPVTEGDFFAAPDKQPPPPPRWVIRELTGIVQGIWEKSASNYLLLNLFSF